MKASKKIIYLITLFIWFQANWRASASSVTLPEAICDVRSTPAVSSDGVVYVSDSQNLYAYQVPAHAFPISGLARSTTDKLPFIDRAVPTMTPQLCTGSPAIGPDGTIYVGSIDGHMYAVNTDGTVKWTFACPDVYDYYPNTLYSVVCTPAISPYGAVYFGDTGGNFYALDSSGNLIRGFPVPPPDRYTNYAYYGSPVIGMGGVVYVVRDPGALVAFLGTNYVGISTQTIMGFHDDYWALGITPSIGPDGTVYLSSVSSTTSTDEIPGMVLAFNPMPDASGVLETKWTYTFPSFGDDNARSPTTTPLIDETDADGNFKMYICTDTDELFALTCNDSGVSSVESYFFLSEYFSDPNYSYPIMSTPALDSGGNIWVCSYDNHLYKLATDDITSGPCYAFSFPFDYYVNIYNSAHREIDSSPVILPNGTLLIAGSATSSSWPPVYPYEYLLAYDIGNGPANVPWPMWRQNQYQNPTNAVPAPLLVNLQMRWYDGPVKTGTEAIGNSSSDYWNQAIGGDNGTLTNYCLDSYGLPSPVIITITGVDVGAIDTASYTDPLFESFAGQSDGGDFQISVSLPTGTYDFYLYGTYAYSSWPTQYPTFQVDSGIVGVTDYSSYVGSTGAGNPTVSFTDIPVDGNTPIVFDVEPGSAIAPANGLQILRH